MSLNKVLLSEVGFAVVVTAIYVVALLDGAPFWLRVTAGVIVFAAFFLNILGAVRSYRYHQKVRESLANLGPALSQQLAATMAQRPPPPAPGYATLTTDTDPELVKLRLENGRMYDELVRLRRDVEFWRSQVETPELQSVGEA